MEGLARSPAETTLKQHIYWEKHYYNQQRQVMADVKRVYTFGNKEAEGNGKMRELLGGKGANLAEMNLIGIPVPPGFTITTEVCSEYYAQGREKVVGLLRPEVEKAMKNIEKLTGMKFGDKEMPLLVSVRSGARASMPGMMDTILNLGMNDQAVEAVAKRTGNPRFAWDSYRRFVQMYGDVVLGMKPASKEEHDPFEELIDAQKEKRGVKNDTDLTTDDLKELVHNFKAAVKKQTGEDFPANPWDQLWGAICAVFGSWMNERAILYRKLNNIPAEWGTAVSVQAMVFGNMGDNSATGVAFSRDAATGENLFNGEYLINAQGEDVVAGIRTPQQITIEGSRRWAKAQNVSEAERRSKYPSLEEVMPAVYKELNEIQHHLEQYFKDMQDIEFTIQDGKLWMLQCRNGKRTGAAMVKIAMDMLREGLIDEKTAVLRCEPAKLDELLHPVFDKTAMKNAKVIVKGLPASPGAATGPVVFFAEDAEKMLKEKNQRAILVRIETSPEDLKGMLDAAGIPTARGGRACPSPRPCAGGGVSTAEIYDLEPFGSTVCTVLMTPEQMRRLIMTKFNDPVNVDESHRIDLYSTTPYTILTDERGEAVDVLFPELAEGRVYKVSIGDYPYKNYADFLYDDGQDTGILITDLLLDYFRSHSPAAPDNVMRQQIRPRQ